MSLSPELRRALLANGLRRGLQKLAQEPMAGGEALAPAPAGMGAPPSPSAPPAKPAPPAPAAGPQASVIIHCNSDCMNLTENGLCGLTSVCWNQMAPSTNEGGCSQYRPGAQAEMADAAEQQPDMGQPAYEGP